jgi:hypothetical protein
MLIKNTKVHCLFYRLIDLGQAGTKADKQFIADC